MTGLVAWIAIGGLVVFVILPALWAVLLIPRRREERELEDRYRYGHLPEPHTPDPGVPEKYPRMTAQRRRQLERWLEETQR